MLAFTVTFLAIMLLSMLGCRSFKTMFVLGLFIGLAEMSLVN